MENFFKISTLLLALTCVAVSLDEDKFREIKYSAIEPEVDMEWMGSIKLWYIPLWSKMDKVRTMADMFGMPVEKLTEKEWNTKACGTFDSDSIVRKFNRKVKFDCQPLLGEAEKVEGLQCRAPREGAIGLKFRFTLTDNKDYILGVNEWEDGEASWAVISVKQTLEEEDKQQILHLVQGLGFRKDMVVEENYVGCNIAKSEL